MSAEISLDEAEKRGLTIAGVLRGLIDCAIETTSFDASPRPICLLLNNYARKNGVRLGLTSEQLYTAKGAVEYEKNAGKPVGDVSG